MNLFFLGRRHDIGMDLGASQVQWAVRGRGNAVASLGSAELVPARTSADETLADAALAARLRDIVADNARVLQGRKVTLAAPGRTLRGYVELPAEARSDPGLAASSAIRHSLPLSLTDLRLSFVQVRPLRDPASLALFWTAVRRDAVERLGRVVADAGLEMAGMLCPTLALARHYRANHAPPDDVCELLLHVGFTESTLVLMRGGHPYGARSFDGGGRDLTQAVMQHHQSTWEAAEGVRRGLDLRERRPEVEPAVDAWLREVRSTLRYFDAQFGDLGDRMQVTAIRVSGGTSAQPGLAERLADEVGRPVRREGFENLRVENPEHATSHGYEVALGLALREEEAPR